MLTIHPIRSRMANAYLIENENVLFLADACEPGRHAQILRTVNALGKPLKLIFITHAHFDHYGSAGALRALSGAKIAIHQTDAEAMARGQTPIRSARGRGRLSRPFLPLVNRPHSRLGTQADLLLQDGSRLDDYGLPGQVLYTPGHTAGSACLLVEGGGSGLLAFGGDLVIGGRHPHLQGLYADDWDQLARSLARLQAARPALVYPGHGRYPIPGDVLQKLAP